MKIFKNIILTLGIILAVVSFIAIFLPFFIDLNHFKPQIQNFVANKFHAKMDFDSARLNIFGGLGIKFKNISLENLEKPFANEQIFSAEDVDIRFDTLPLFKKQFIGAMDIDKPTLKITKIGNQNNISSLFEQQKGTTDTNSPSQSEPNTSSYSFVINEFYVNNAHLIFTDLTQPKKPTVIDIQNLNLDSTSDGKTVDINKLTLKVFSGTLVSNGKIHLDTSPISYSGSCDLKKISIADVIRSFGGSPSTKDVSIKGIADINFNFNGKGTTESEYSKSLNGKGFFKIRQGELSLNAVIPIILDQLGKFLSNLNVGNLVGMLIPTEDLNKAGNIINQKISLDNMKGNFEVKKGVLLLNNNIQMVQGLLNLNVAINLFTSKLSGDARFVATDNFTKTLLATNKNFSYLLDKDKKVHILVHLSGTVSNPNFSLDTKDLLGVVLLHTTEKLLNPLKTIHENLKSILPF